MLRFLVIALVLCVLVRWGFGKWPWDYLRGPSSRGREVAEARRLLGVGPSANRTDIIAAHKRLVGRVHPDRGGSSPAMHEANAARDLLLNELPKDLPPQ